MIRRFKLLLTFLFTACFIFSQAVIVSNAAVQAGKTTDCTGLTGIRLQ